MECGDSHEKSHVQVPGGLSWFLSFLPKNITMQSSERLPWACLVPGGPCAFPTAQMLTASQQELRLMLHGESCKLLEMRRKLVEEIEKISEDFISSNYLETESYLGHVKELKNTYQDNIEDMVDMNSPVLKDCEVLDEWTKEVKEIAKIVKEHANEIRTTVLKLDASFYSEKSINTRAKTALNTVKSSAGRVKHSGVKSSSWLKNILPAPRNLPQPVNGEDHAHKAVSDVDHQPVSGVDNGHKPVSAVNQQPVSVEDHDHKAVNAVNHQLASEGDYGHTVLHNQGKDFHAGQADLNKGIAGLNDAGQNLYQVRGGIDVATQGLYQDSGGGLDAAWLDILKASVWDAGQNIHKSENHTIQGVFHQASHDVSVEGPVAAMQGVYHTGWGEHDIASQGVFYQSGQGGGEYLAARAALYLARVGRPVDAIQDQDEGLGSVNVGDLCQVKGDEPVANAHGVTQDTWRVESQASQCVLSLEQAPGPAPSGYALPGHGVPGQAVVVHALHALAIPDNVLTVHGVPGQPVVVHALHGLALPDTALLGHSVLGQVVLAHVLPGLTLPDQVQHIYAASTLSKTESAVSSGQNNSKEEIARTTSMQFARETTTKVSRSERKVLVRTVLVMFELRKFLARFRQLLQYLVLLECAVTAIVDDIHHGRCLNGTRRAIAAKLGAASWVEAWNVGECNDIGVMLHSCLCEEDIL